MAKNSIPEYSATPSANTDIGGIGIQGTNSASNMDDALREHMAHEKEFLASPTFEGQLLAPVSATVPAYSATGDTDTGFGFSAANTAYVMTGGTVRASVTSAGAAVTGAITATSSMSATGFTATGNVSGARLLAESGTEGTPSIAFSTDGDTGLYRDGANGLGFVTGGEHCGKFASTGSFLVGDAAYTGSSINDVGTNLQGVDSSNPGAISTTTSGAAGLFMNRITSSGNLQEFYSSGTFVGSISFSGTIVSYNAFCGSHWSQLADHSMPTILRGTIVETIDEMCAWPGEENEQLARFKISDTPGSQSVYGVFMDWTKDGNPNGPEVQTSDALISSLGACVVRIASGQTVARGDLIESNGDGCGRVQSDTVMRSSTVAKVTSPSVIETYPDGSYLVPATLHCG